MLSQQQPNTINYKKEKIIELLIRWWSIGAVYFLFGFGIVSFSHIDDIFLITIGVWLMTAIVVNPVCKAMLDTKKMDKRRYNEIPLYEKLLNHLKVLITALVIVAAVVYTYHIINITINSLFNYPKETVKLPAEPFLFAMFYMLYYILLTTIAKLIVNIFKNRRKGANL